MSEEKKPYRIEGRPPTIYRIVKSPENPYVSIDRRPVDNALLSFKAKGILTYLMSRPDGWEVSVADLVKHATDGEASIRSGLKELKDFGHMKYTKLREKGRITGWLIEVFEVPISSPDSDFQDVENPDVAFQDVENQGQVLSTSSINDSNTNKDGATPTPKMPKPSKEEKPRTAKATDFPELVLYRSVTELWPPKACWDSVVKKMHDISVRLGRQPTKEDIFPYFEAWCGNGWSKVDVLNWLDYAVRGVIPVKGQNTTWKSGGAAMPKGAEAALTWLQKQEAN